MKLYREVKCSDRLPEKDTECYTDVGLAEYCGNDNWIVNYPEDGGFVFGQNVVKFWLEPYELPTEEEIIERCKSELLKQLHLMIYKNGYPTEAVPKATILSLDKLVATGKSKP